LKSLKSLHALATTLILSGLLPGCAVERQCDAGGCLDDANITASVRTQINQHPDVGPPNTVHVQTVDHVVYLSGEVSQGLMKQTAEDVARQTPGVTRIVNDISVTK
jgi:osmotically-inducible protein OsmY